MTQVDEHSRETQKREKIFGEIASTLSERAESM